jgi:glycosyltransferase involved in cell wall biosynthesis
LTVARALVGAQRSLGVDARLVYLYSSPNEVAGPLAEFESHCRIQRGRRFLSGIPALRQVLREMSVDVVHHHDSPAWSRVATAFSGVPHVEHGHLALASEPSSAVSALLRRVVISRAQAVFAVSQEVSASWEAAGYPPGRVHLVPNGVDLTRFFPVSGSERLAARSRLGLPADGRLVLWAGRLDRDRKGLDRLLSFARSLPAGVALVVAGGGQDSHWLSEEVRRFPEASRPRLLGNVPDPAPLFGCCDAFVFTSRGETFGLVLLEAAASGLPIYATECTGGGAEVLAQLAELVVPEGSEHLLAEAISGNRLPGPRLSRECIRLRYSWDACAKSCVEVYQRLAGRIS